MCNVLLTTQIFTTRSLYLFIKHCIIKMRNIIFVLFRTIFALIHHFKTKYLMQFRV